MRLSLSPGTKGLAALVLIIGAALLSPAPAFAQSAADAQLLVRMQDLENTVRDLTGQLEKLQNTVTLLQQELQQTQADEDARNAGKKPVTTPRPLVPQSLPQAQPTAGDTSTATVTATPAPTPLLSDQTAGAPSAQSADGLGQSADPLVGKGGGTADLGTLPAGTGGQALNLNLNSSQPISNGDADAQYKAGYDAVTRGDYPFAEQQFKQFIELYPKDPQAADATNWLAEALLQRQDYNDAIDALTDGIKNYPDSPRVPDMLLKLAIATEGADTPGDVACRIFFKLTKEYPKESPAFLQRVQEEKTKAKCPV